MFSWLLIEIKHPVTGVCGYCVGGTICERWQAHGQSGLACDSCVGSADTRSLRPPDLREVHVIQCKRPLTLKITSVGL